MLFPFADHHGALMRRCLLVFYGGLLLLLSVSAPAEVLRFDRLTIEDGLSQSNVFALAEDSNGHLWFGTESALDRYDGYQFDSFRSDPDDPSTLSFGRIYALDSSSAGKLWVGTGLGVDRLDLRSKLIQRFAPPAAFDPIVGQLLVDHQCPDQPLAVNSLGQLMRVDPATQRLQAVRWPDGRVDHQVRTMTRGTDGRLRLATDTQLWRWHCERQTLESLAITAETPPHYGSSNGILSVSADGQLLVATATGLHVYDPDSGERLGIVDPREQGFDTSIVHAVETDAYGGVWLRLPADLVRIAPGQLLRRGPWPGHVPLEASPELPSHRYLLRVATSGDGRVWTAGSFGLYTYQPGGGAIVPVRHDPSRSDSLPQSINDAGYQLLTDRFGVLWIGTHLGGIVRYVPERHRFNSLHSPRPSSDIIRGISEVVQDDQRWLLTGVDDDGVYMWQMSADQPPQLLRHFSVDAPAPHTLPSNHLRSLMAQPDQAAVWAWGEHWLGRIHLADHRFELVAKTGETNDRYRGITAVPDQNRLLVHTRHDLFWVDLEDATDQPNRTPSLTSVDWIQRVFGGRSPPISATLPLADGRMVIGLRNGWVLFDPERGHGEHHLLAPDQPWGSSNSVITLAKTSDGAVWAGTHDGLARLDITLGAVSRWWRERDGLPDQTIYAILPEADQQLWLSTNRGLVRLNVDTGQIETFGSTDGMRNYEFNSRVGQMGASGHFYFGGLSGITYFQPQHIRPHPIPPNVQLKRLNVNERPMPLADLRQRLTLRHNENNIVFEFVGLHFMAPHLNQYRYRLDGLEADWIEAGTQRQVRYSSLGAGHYDFWVSAANADGVWSEPVHLASVAIKPPFWLSWWAYMGYFSAFVLLMASLIVAANRRRRQLEALVAERTSELDHKNELVSRQATELEQALAARTTLFANISHEFRTPLTLIQAALQRLEEQRDHPNAIPLAQSYTQRLTRLVDQLLDLSRLRMHGVQPTDAPWSLAPILRITTEAFDHHAAQRGIDLKITIESDWSTQCDQPSVEKIVLNLLTNALKFTPAGGRVRLTLAAGEQEGEARITVTDTGPGIPEDQQDIVFERFQRLPSQEMTLIEGAGIGLALVREAAHAVGGRVTLVSQPGHGCTFSVFLPAQAAVEETAKEHSQFQSVQRLTLDAALLEEPHYEHSAGTSKAPTADGEHLGNLLLVEDNRDLRDYLTGLLSRDWSVIPAAHGEEALERLKVHDITVIVSDIMMPHMDGLELLQHVRSDLSSSHIPFLILSARRDVETRIAGLAMAADDFLTKPFDARELRLKLRNMAERRRSQIHQLRHELQAQAEHSMGVLQVAENDPHQALSLSPRDQRFAERLKQWLARHHDNPDCTVAEMARDLAVDQRTLQRKVKALYDCAPSECLNEYRINKAQAALLESAKSIQEIAFDCGFNSAKSFSRTFQRHAGCSPSAWRNQHAA